MKTKIYVITEPDGKIRYVGKTKYSLKRRLTRHIYDARKGIKNHRCCWIKSLLSKGYLPIITILGEVDGDGSKEEIAWIKYLRDENAKLVNLTDGGDGTTGHIASEETRQRMKVAAKLRFQNPEEREKQRIRCIGRIPSSETIEKRRKALLKAWSNPIKRLERCVSNRASWNEERKRKYGDKMIAYWNAHPEEKEKRRIRFLEHNPRKRKVA